MSFHQGNAVTATRRGSFVGWTPRHEHTNKSSYYERLRDSALGHARDRRMSTRVAGGWEGVIGSGDLDLRAEQEYKYQEQQEQRGGNLYSTPYGAGRSRPDRLPRGAIQPGSPGSPGSRASSNINLLGNSQNVRVLRSITMTAAAEADETAQLPIRVVDDGAPPTVYSAAEPALGALEYSTSDLFGYFSHHELDWYHVVDSEEFQPEEAAAVKVSTSTAASRANSVVKLDALLHKLGLPHLCKTFRERGISFRGIVNMAPQHFQALGVSKEDRTRIISALRFARTLEPTSRQTVLRTGFGGGGGGAGEEERREKDVAAAEPSLPLPLQRQRPRYMVSPRRYDNYYRGPLFGQNAATFMGGRHNIKVGNGDAMASLFWAGTLRAKPGTHHHSDHFERNYIRHEGVTLNSSHIDPKLTHSSLPPKAADLRKHQSDGTPIDHPRRNTVHLIGQNAPWANVDQSPLVEDFD
jgi:hypothetical protein